MKLFISFLVVGMLNSTAFAQKKYVDPGERVKRGLLEEAPEATKVVEGSSKVEASIKLTPQEQLCECQKLYEINKSMWDAWRWADRPEKVSYENDDFFDREKNIKATQAHIIKNAPQPKPMLRACAALEVKYPNLNVYDEKIKAQEQKCDVFGLRGL